MAETEKKSNFLQIYYYRRASACYPYKVEGKTKKQSNQPLIERIFKLFKKNG